MGASHKRIYKQTLIRSKKSTMELHDTPPNWSTIFKQSFNILHRLLFILKSPVTSVCWNGPHNACRVVFHTTRRPNTPHQTVIKSITLLGITQIISQCANDHSSLAIGLCSNRCSTDSQLQLHIIHLLTTSSFHLTYLWSIWNSRLLPKQKKKIILRRALLPKHLFNGM